MTKKNERMLKIADDIFSKEEKWEEKFLDHVDNVLCTRNDCAIRFRHKDIYDIVSKYLKYNKEVLIKCRKGKIVIEES